MSVSVRTRWWGVLTAALGTMLIAAAALVTVTGADDSGGSLIGAAAWAAGGGLVLTGLLRQRTSIVQGSRMILAGAALTVAGDFALIPVGIAVAVSGLWTGNLQLTDAADDPDLEPVSRQQLDMTRHWWLWLVVAVALFAIGWLPLIFDDPDDLSTVGWATWLLSWLSAIVTAGIGVILAGLRLVVRHRTRLV